MLSHSLRRTDEYLLPLCYSAYFVYNKTLQTKKQFWLARDDVYPHVAGHSLGGALATLAAYDIRKQLLDNNQPDTKVVCYTFAAPRTGNHAFAREYNAMVPDTWSVINDQVCFQLLLQTLPVMFVCFSSMVKGVVLWIYVLL